jgi:hypothetical protein
MSVSNLDLEKLKTQPLSIVSGFVSLVGAGASNIVINGINDNCIVILTPCKSSAAAFVICNLTVTIGLNNLDIVPSVACSDQYYYNVLMYPA